MNEEQLKFLYKWIIENSNKQLSPVGKELLKKAIDDAHTVEELAMVLCVYI